MLTGGTQLRHGEVADRSGSGGEVLADVRGGGLLDDLDISSPDMAGAGRLGLPVTART